MKQSSNKRKAGYFNRTSRESSIPLTKLIVENLEDRRVLSAFGISNAAAIEALTSSSSIISGEERPAPIDLSSALFDSSAPIVTSIADDGSEGTLRYAVENAAPNATITFDASISGETIVLSGSEISIVSNLTIDGAGANITLDAAGESRIFRVATGVSANINGLTFVNGRTLDEGGAISATGAAVVVSNSYFTNNGAESGGAIYANGGSIKLQNVVLKNNVASESGAAIRTTDADFYGVRATVVANGANGIDAQGAVYVSGGAASLVNSLVADNVDSAFFIDLGEETFRLVNDTIAKNGGDAIVSQSGRYEIYNAIVSDDRLFDDQTILSGGSVVVANSILADEDYRLLSESDREANLSSSTGSLFADAENGDYALAQSSIAIDAGDAVVWNAQVVEASDYYAYDVGYNTRIVGSSIDIGAYERQTPGGTNPSGGENYETPSIIVTTTRDVIDPTDGEISLREAVEVYFAYATRDFDRTIVPYGRSVTFDLPYANAPVRVNHGEIRIYDSMKIYGGETATITIDANGKSRLFKVTNGVQSVEFEGLKLKNGNAGGAAQSGAAYNASSAGNNGGGAIYATTTDISVRNSTSVGNYGYVGGSIFVNGGTLTVENVVFNGDESGYQGGSIAVYASSSASGTSLDVVNSTFLNGRSERAGAVYFKDGVASVKSTSFSGNVASYSNGGAIAVANATMTITNATMTANEANRFGGAVFAGGSQVTLNNGENYDISGNKAEYGGAIYNSKGTLDVNAGRFTENESRESGGAIYSTGAVATKGVFEENAAGENGGAIYSSGGVSVPSGTFSQNRATNSGGAIYAINGAFSVSDADFISNVASAGGGIRVTKSQSARLERVLFSGNSATGAGGAINVSASEPLTAYRCSFEGNSAVNSGGAIYAASGAKVVSDYSQFNGNTTTKFGGAIAVVGNSELTISGGAIKNSAASSGGAIYVANSGATFSDRAEVAENIANKHGGGVYSVNGEITATESLFNKNVATNSGGALFASKGSVTIQGGSIRENVATTGSGGAIYISSGEILRIAAYPDISENQAKGSGGAIYSAGTEIEIKSVNRRVTFTNNESSKFGGAIYVVGADANVAAGTFTSNDAVSGGAIYASNGSFSINDSTFSYNEAQSFGGGVFVVGGNLSITASDFGRNTATGAGGALNLDNSTTVISDSNVRYNASRLGGGIRQKNGRLEISSSEVSWNQATSAGGGVYQLGGTSQITDVSFSSNSADVESAHSKGGAIYVGSGSSTVQRSYFSSNSAKQGAAISTLKATGFNVYNSAFIYNITPSQERNGALAFGNSSFKIVNATVAHNQVNAVAHGFAVSATNSSGSIVNSIIWGNPSNVLLRNSAVSVSYTISNFERWDDGTNNFEAERWLHSGNLDCYPGFIVWNNDARDMRLNPDSLAINAGNSGSAVGTLDLGDAPRKVGRVDIGAYEYQGSSSSLLDEAFAELFVEELD